MENNQIEQFREEFYNKAGEYIRQNQDKYWASKEHSNSYNVPISMFGAFSESVFGKCYSKIISLEPNGRMVLRVVDDMFSTHYDLPYKNSESALTVYVRNWTGYTIDGCIKQDMLYEPYEKKELPKYIQLLLDSDVDMVGGGYMICIKENMTEDDITKEVKNIINKVKQRSA